MRNLTLSVSLRTGRYEPEHVIHTQIPYLFEKHFQPIDVCSDPITSLATGSVPPHEYVRLLEKRETVAKVLAAEITDSLMKIMAKDDTKNGYPNGT